MLLSICLVYLSLPSFTGFYLVLLSFFLVLPSFTGLYHVQLSYTWFYWVLPSFFHGMYLFFLCSLFLLNVYLVLLGFT